MLRLSRRQLCLGLVSVLFILKPFPAAVYSQHGNCDPDLKKIDGPFGYSIRGSRCEGLYESPVASSLSIVSVMRGELRYKLRPDNALIVKSVDNINLDAEELHIRSVGRYSGIYYRMDCVVSKGDSLIWPMGEVLEPNRLLQNKIGLYGWFELSEGRIFIPLIARELVGSFASGPLRALVRTDIPADEIKWRYAENNEAPTEWKLYGENIAANEIITIDLKEGAEAVVRVELMLLPKNSDHWEPLIFNVLRNKQ